MLNSEVQIKPLYARIMGAQAPLLFGNIGRKGDQIGPLNRFPTCRSTGSFAKRLGGDSSAFRSHAWPVSANVSPSYGAICGRGVSKRSLWEQPELETTHCRSSRPRGPTRPVPTALELYDLPRPQRRRMDV